jgi:hypothetical protein
MRLVVLNQPIQRRAKHSQAAAADLGAFQSTIFDPPVNRPTAYRQDICRFSDTQELLIHRNLL